MQGWQQSQDAILLGVADPNLEKAASAATLRGEAAAFASLADMASVLPLDAVDIVTPPHLHATLCTEAFELGLDVMCQKPLAPTLAEATGIVQSVPDKRRLMVHENWRWRPTYRLLNAALSDGRLPRPDHFELRVESSGLLPRLDGSYPAIERQPFFQNLERFIIIEVLIHHLDTLSFLFGPIEVLSCQIDRRCPAMRAEDFAAITLKAGGIRGRLVGDFCCHGTEERPEDRLFLNGAKQPILDGWSVTFDPAAPLSFDPREAYQKSYSSTIDHFSRSIRNGKAFESSPTEALNILAAVERCYEIAEWR